MPHDATLSDGPKTSHSPSFGLREGALSPLETLAQSVSTIAPSTSPTLTVPLVFALAGAGTVAAYGVAMGLIVLVALCVAQFARESASPGSLFVYTRRSLPPIFSSITAWALFWAYVFTAASVIGGFENFAVVLLPAWGAHVPSVLLAAVAAGGALYIALRDVKVSAQLMLWIEAVSVTLIVFVVAVTLIRYGLHFDRTQFLARNMSFAGVRQGVMLALFSFVGFESATTLGAEARQPLRTIPRAVVQSALFAGILFLVCAYGEVLGFHNSPIALDTSLAPMRYLSMQGGFAFVGVIIDAGVLVSMFAGTLACVIAASRVLLLMAHHGLAHPRFTRTHRTHDTPVLASVVAALAAFLPCAVLAFHGSSGADVYGWMGTLAVFGFLTAYLLVAVALAAHRHHQGKLTAATLALSLLASLAMLAALAGNIWPLPAAPYRYFPYVYLSYLALAVAWMLLTGAHRREVS